MNALIPESRLIKYHRYVSMKNIRRHDRIATDRPDSEKFGEYYILGSGFRFLELGFIDNLGFRYTAEINHTTYAEIK